MCCHISSARFVSSFGSLALLLVLLVLLVVPRVVLEVVLVVLEVVIREKLTSAALDISR